ATWNLPGTGAVLSGWRLSGVLHAQSGNPYTIRYASDLTGTTLTTCSGRGCNITQPGARNTARGEAVQYLDIALATTLTLVTTRRVEFRAEAFNVMNNQNYVSEGYIGIIGNPNYGKPTGGSTVFPGRQFQFAITYRF